MIGSHCSTQPCGNMQLWTSSRSSVSASASDVVSKLARRRQTKHVHSVHTSLSDDSAPESPKGWQEDLGSYFNAVEDKADRRHREVCSALTTLGQMLDDLDSRIGDILENPNLAKESTPATRAGESGITLEVRSSKQNIFENIGSDEIPSFEPPDKSTDSGDSVHDLPVISRSQKKLNTTLSSNSHGPLIMNALATQVKKRGISSKSSSGSFGMGFASLLQVRDRPEWQKKVWQFLEDPDMARWGRTFMNFVSILICIGVALPFVHLMSDDHSEIDSSSLMTWEFCLDMIFMLETLARLYVSPNRLRFFWNTYNDIDLVAACLPLVLHSYQAHTFDLVEHSTQNTIISCWVPVLRLLKLVRRFETFHVLVKALEEAQEALPMLIFILLLIVLIFASLIFMVEPRDNIVNFPIALWFTIVTVGTIGYGDITPVSTGGILTSSAMIVVSALYMAIPIALVGESFSKVWKDRDRLVLVHRARTRFLNVGYKAEDIPSMFCGWDDDGDGEIDLPEFIQMMRMMEIDMPGPRLVQLFSEFDKDGSGTIDDQEFVRTLFPDAYAELYASVELANANKEEQKTPADEAQMKC